VQLPLGDHRQLVLVVEDHDDALDLTCTLLEHCGYRTACARDGEQAIVMARAMRPDLIVLDLYMPNLSGMEAASALRRDPDTAQIPIVVLSCDGSDEMRAQMASASDAYFTKPIDTRAVTAEIAAQLARRRAGAA
jgi:CheY-like chemotaxis protein